jgi:gliding motility-associatede transport system auxiliary component
MRRAIDFLAPVGFLVIVFAVAWTRAGKHLPGKFEYYVLAGLALALAHVLLRWEGIAHALGIGKRQTKYGANTLVSVLAILALLVGINYVVYRHTKRWDLTKNKQFSLSDETKKVVAGLKDDVTITYFQRSAAMASGQDRLKEYQALSPKIKVEFVDPLKDPIKAQHFDVKGPWPILVVERGTKREKVTSDGEQDLTNAVIKVTRNETKTVCFEEGEGERDIDDSEDQGFSGLKAALGKSQYETKKVALLREKQVPDTCTVFVVAGPQRDLIPEVIDALRAYVKKGGKLLVMLEPETKESFPNVDALLKDWNLETAKDIVVDVSGMGQLFGTGPLTPLVVQYPYHEITKNFRVATAFHTARSIQAGTATVPGVTAQNLVETSAQSWAETDLTLKEPVEMNEGRDRAGPISLGAVATVSIPEPSPSPSPSPASEGGDNPRKPEGRVVAFGDSDFASNALLGFQGNKDFVLNSVAWLAEDADLISIRPKEAEDQRIFLTREQQSGVAWLTLVLLPGLFVVLGIATWWRRR